MTNETKAAEAAKIEAAREALRLAQSREQEAAAALRSADNALALVREGRAGDPVRGAEAMAEARRVYDTRLADYERAAGALIAAESGVKAAERAAAAAVEAAAAPRQPSAAEIDEGHAEALRALAVAREERQGAENRLAEILEKLRACDAEQARLVAAPGDAAKQSRAMAELAGTREILLGRLPLAEAAAAEAVELHARAARDLMAYVNPAARAEKDSAAVLMQDARQALVRVPLARLVAALAAARERLDSAQGPGAYADAAEAYADRLAALREPIREQSAELRALLDAIGGRLAELETKAAEALA